MDLPSILRIGYSLQKGFLNQGVYSLRYRSFREHTQLYNICRCILTRVILQETDNISLNHSKIVFRAYLFQQLIIQTEETPQSYK